ncbi:hypothetical protein F5J12DRAFT_207943 [Pisolithus orientalis]|uniref:uncharacterized protein n=1 Tax=Pisolithus orientalis TaxID=936130 RepID=UPI0022255EB6|nr:uncharacterized protein F5J12DRAFT_207943 [Pisolithus orientalis]KAI6002640.1 hypothetical protein F5J12DRAFT_207943 [Pisolithus orientalis]
MPSSSLARLGGLRNMVMRTLLTSELSEDLMAVGTREPFFDSSVCPPSNMVPPPSLEPCGHVLSGGIPTSTCPPIASNVADGTMVNAGTIPISLDRPMLRPGGGDNRERMDGIDHNSDNAPYSVAPSWSLSDASRSLPHKLQPTHNIGNLSIPKKSPRTDRSTGPSTSLPTAPKRCGWRDNDGKICDMPVTYNNLVHHFAAVHDIKDMAFDAIIECRWCRPGNRMKRESILRHLREKHLGYPRRKNGVTRLSLQFPSMTSSHSAMNTGTPVESPTFALPYLPYPVSPSSALSPRSCNFSTSASSVAIPPTSPSLWKQNEYSVLDFTSSCDFYRTED